MPESFALRVGLGVAIGFAALAQAAAAASLEVPILYLRHEIERPPVLSNLDPVPEDLGVAGAEVALADIQTTGRFLGQSYSLNVVSVPAGDDFVAAARAALPQAGLVVLDAPAEDQLAIVDLPEAGGKLFFNATAGDARLRSGDCRANLLHTLPEDAARTDALMQVLLSKQWTHLAMIVGPKPADQSYADNLRTSAAKFGLTIEGEKAWTFDTDLRRAATKELPPFTQDLPDHDVILVADETDDFGRYVQDNTWLPRPIAGSEGLEPLAWSRNLEQWGAVQLQDRFRSQSHRDMLSVDYAGWLAVRAVGEAVTRTGSNDAMTLRAFMLSKDYELDGFKGRGLTFRPWNGQLRQPVAVANPRALVLLAPVEGFLHQTNELDTLGLDAPESACRQFGG